MTRVQISAVLLAGWTTLAVPVRAADNVFAQRLATCQDTWLDWKDDPAKVKEFGDQFLAAFMQNGNEPFFVPRKALTILGLEVTKVFPESVGMAVGFSVMVKAGFDAARKSLEKALGKPLKNCDNGDQMRSCGLEIASKRTVMLMAADADKTEALVGCYYYYAK